MTRVVRQTQKNQAGIIIIFTNLQTLGPTGRQLEMTGNNTLFNSPHRRYNPLTREWILVSPHRAKRPWQGQVEKDSAGKSAGVRSHLLPVPRQ